MTRLASVSASGGSGVEIDEPDAGPHKVGRQSPPATASGQLHHQHRQQAHQQQQQQQLEPIQQQLHQHQAEQTRQSAAGERRGGGGGQLHRRIDQQSSGSLDSAVIEVQGAHTVMDLRRKSMSVAAGGQQQTAGAVRTKVGANQGSSGQQAPLAARLIRRNPAIDYTNMSPRESIRLTSQSLDQQRRRDTPAESRPATVDNQDQDGKVKEGDEQAGEQSMGDSRDRVSSSVDKSRRLQSLSELHKHKRIVQSCSSSTLASQRAPGTSNCSPSTSASRAASLSFDYYEERTADKRAASANASGAGPNKPSPMDELQEGEPPDESGEQVHQIHQLDSCTADREPDSAPTFILLDTSNVDRKRASSIEHTHILIEPPSPPTPPSPNTKMRLDGLGGGGGGGGPARDLQVRKRVVVVEETDSGLEAGGAEGEDGRPDQAEEQAAAAGLVRRPASSCGSARTPLGAGEGASLRRLSQSASSSPSPPTMAGAGLTSVQDNNYRVTLQQQQQQQHTHASDHFGRPEICLRGPAVGAQVHQHHQWRDTAAVSQPPARNKSVSIACSGTGASGPIGCAAGELAFRRLAETYRASTERRMSRLACARSLAQLSSLGGCQCAHCCLPADLLCQQLKRRVSSACIMPASRLVPPPAKSARQQHQQEPGTGNSSTVTAAAAAAAAAPHQRHQSFCAGERVAATATKTSTAPIATGSTTLGATDQCEPPDDKRPLSGCLLHTAGSSHQHQLQHLGHSHQKSAAAATAATAPGAGLASGARKYAAVRRCCSHCGSPDCSGQQQQQQQAVSAMHQLRAIQLRHQQQQQQYLGAAAPGDQLSLEREIIRLGAGGCCCCSGAGCTSCGEPPARPSDELLLVHEDFERQHASLSPGARSGCRPRISSVFAQSPYAHSTHRDSFVALRLLSQKKSKSAEDIAYLSSLVLQIWTRPRPNPLLQSVSQLQLNERAAATASSGGGGAQSNSKPRCASSASTSNICLAALGARRRQ